MFRDVVFSHANLGIRRIMAFCTFAPRSHRDTSGNNIRHHCRMSQVLGVASPALVPDTITCSASTSTKKSLCVHGQFCGISTTNSLIHLQHIQNPQNIIISSIFPTYPAFKVATARGSGSRIPDVTLVSFTSLP